MAKKKTSDNFNPFGLSNLKYTNKFLLIICLVLFAFGLVMIFSSSSVTAFVRYKRTPYFFAVRQGIFLGIGIFVFLITCNIDTSHYGKLSWLGILGCIGLLLFTFVNGVSANETIGWVQIGPFKFQPSELTKVMLIAWISTFFEIKRLGINKMGVNLFFFAITFVMAGLIVVANDFGTAFILLAIGYLLYILVPINGFVKLKTLVIVTTLGVVVLLGYYIFDTSSFQRQTSRLMNFTNPCTEENFYSTANTVCNSIIAIHNRNLTAKALGNST